MNRFTMPIVRNSALICLLFVSLGIYGKIQAQLTGIKTIPGDYATFMLAVADLNNQGVGPGGVTFNIAAGYVETNVKAIIAIPNNPPTVQRPLVFQKSGFGANPRLLGTGNSNYDGIVSLSGTDYTTFDAIDLQCNPSNGNSSLRMEWGYGLFKATSSNACQYVVIKNCVITMNKAHVTSTGIFSSSTFVSNPSGIIPTSFSGTNSFNQFLSNTIQNSYFGYKIMGYRLSTPPYEFQERGNRIGKDTITNLPSRVLNFGGSSQISYGIFMDVQDDFSISGTTVNSTGGTNSTGALYGIFAEFAFNNSYEIHHDTVTIVGGGSTANIFAVHASGFLSKGNKVRIYSNVIQNCSYPTATSGDLGILKSDHGDIREIFDNKILNCTTNIATPRLIDLQTAAEQECHIYGNVFSGNHSNTTTSMISCSGGEKTYIHDNNVFNNYAGQLIGINATMAGRGEIYDNHIHDNTGGTGGVRGISILSAGGYNITNAVRDNIIQDNTGNGPMEGIRTTNSEAVSIYRNTIRNLISTQTSGTLNTVGVRADASGNTEIMIANNMISELKAPASTSTEAIVGIVAEGNTSSNIRIYHNTIYLDATSSSTTSFGTSGIHLFTGSNDCDVQNNIIVNLSAPGPSSGSTIGLFKSAAYYPYAGNNCIYVGTPSTNRLISNGAQTIQAYRDAVAPHDQAAISELPPFVNVAMPPYDLHLQPNVPTGCESGGSLITPMMSDFDQDPRYGYPGHPSGTFLPIACDIGADEFAGTPLDYSPPILLFPSLGRDVVGTYRNVPNWLMATDRSGIDNAPGTKPRLYYKKSTHSNTYLDNTSATNGWKYVEATNSSAPYGFLIDYSKLFGGSVSTGNTIQYFVVAQDLSGPVIVGKNTATFATQPASVNLNPANFPVTGSINAYDIVSTGFSGVVNVGPGQTYTNLTNLGGGIFSAINGSTLTGNLTIRITGDITNESGYMPLLEWQETGGRGYTITIVPDAAVVRTISGPSSSSPLIGIDGADRLTIDGRFGGTGRYLRFRNTSSNSTVGFLNNARDNTVRNCILEGGHAPLTGYRSVVNFGSSVLSPGAQGNDNNRIMHCDIRDRSDVAAYPGVGVYAKSNVGNLNARNDSCYISNNLIHDFWMDGNTDVFGIDIEGGNEEFFIDSNSIYQTIPRTATITNLKLGGIQIWTTYGAGEGPGFRVKDNFVGGSAPRCQGAPWTMTSTGNVVSMFYGIFLFNGGKRHHTVTGNVINNINYTGVQTSQDNFAAFLGIGTGDGHVDIIGNRIGSASGQDSISVTTNGTVAMQPILGIALGHLVNSTSAAYLEGKVEDNVIGAIKINPNGTGITQARLLSVMGSRYQDTIVVRNNWIGSPSTPASIRALATTSGCEIIPISVLSELGVILMDSNHVQNVVDLSTGSNRKMIGASIGDGDSKLPSVSFKSNTIQDLYSASSLANDPLALTGIAVRNNSTDNQIVNNHIHHLALTNSGASSAYISGIATVFNEPRGLILGNKIHDLENVSSGNPALFGIHINAGSGWITANNMISLSNGVNTNSIVLQGIVNNELIVPGACLYNSIYLGGVASGSLGSLGIVRKNSSKWAIHNNLVYNERSGGTGSHYAIGNQHAGIEENWLPSTSSYNTFIVTNGTAVGEWGTGSPQTFAQWKFLSQGDVESYADIDTTVLADSLFVGVDSADLRIITSNVNCWYANGKGIAGAATHFIPSDQEGTLRSILLGTPSDIGADEFEPDSATLPIPAIASGPPVLGTTTTYSFAGRTLGEIVWGNSGNVPSSITWRYYSSVPPPGATGSNINSYWEVIDTSGNGFNYLLNSFYTIHEQNQLPDPVLNLGRQTGTSPWQYLAGTASSGTAGKYFERTGLNSFTKFTLGSGPPTPDHTIIASVLGGTGSITPSGTIVVTPLNDQSFTISSPSCIPVDSVILDGINMGVMNNYTFSQVSANHTIGVYFGSTTLPPTVTTIANTGPVACPNTPVVFTATALNGGLTPTFLWLLNGNPVGTNDSIYTDSTLVSGDTIICVLTSSDTCSSPGTIASFPIIMTIGDTLPPTVLCRNINLALVSGFASITAAMLDSGSTDACGLDTLVLNQYSFSCSHTGINPVVLSATDFNGNSDSCTAMVTVIAPALIGNATPDTLACGHQISCDGASDGTAHANPSGGCGAYQFLWSNGDTTATISGLVPGTYFLTITDGAGGQEFDTVSISAPSAIIATVDTVSQTCLNDSTGFIQLSAAGGNDCLPYSFLWSNGASSNALSSLQQGTYTCTVTDVAGCTMTQAVTVTAFPAPLPQITQSGNFLLTSQAWSSYQWLFNGAPISGANASTYTAIASGSYQVVVTDSNGCEGISNTLNITVVGSENPQGDLQRLMLSPNPTHNIFLLSSQHPILQELKITLRNTLGVNVLSRTLPSLESEAEFDVHQLPAGTYFIEVSAASTKRQFHLVIL